jgi:dTDP-4-amino-4,6-dideoxygalactose transaminase
MTQVGVQVSMKPFENPIYVTKPLLPSLASMYEEIESIWSSGQLTNNGPKHAALESTLLGMLRVPNLSLFNNGTIAMIVACQSLRLSGEVITTPFTFPATPHVLTWNNVQPVFCDIDPESLCIDATKLEGLITAKTTGILGVHVYGNPCDVVKIQELADRYGLRIIYDAAHAFGVELVDRGIGSFGDISMFSFHATKLFHTLEGGALTFNDKNLKARIELLKNFGIKGEEEVILPGINGKMNEMQAAVGLLLSKQVEDEREKRSKVMSHYMAKLEEVPGLSFVTHNTNFRNSYQYCVIRVDKDVFGKTRDDLHTFL